MFVIGIDPHKGSPQPRWDADPLLDDDFGVSPSTSRPARCTADFATLRDGCLELAGSSGSVRGASPKEEPCIDCA